MKSRKQVEDSFEAVPAYIVADKRDKFGRRLGNAAIILLLLFFAISSYVQSAKNGQELDESRKQRELLVQSQERITLALEGQGALIVSLQGIITRQNTALRTAGLPVEPVPNLQDLIDQAMGQQSPSPRPSSRSSTRSNPKPTPSPKASPKSGAQPKPNPQPDPKPSPSPSPTKGPVRQLVCDLSGICQNRSTNAEPRSGTTRQGLRSAQVDCADCTAGVGYALFGLGLAARQRGKRRYDRNRRVPGNDPRA